MNQIKTAGQRVTDEEVATGGGTVTMSFAMHHARMLEIAELREQNEQLRTAAGLSGDAQRVERAEPSEAEKELEALKSHASGMTRAAENSAKHASIEIEALRVRASGLRAQLKESIAYMEIVMETEHHPSYYPTLAHAIEVFLKHSREVAEHD